jgi:hypothetical protein
MAELTRIVLAGEGGQGVQTVAEILAEAANEEGKQALYIPNFGVEQRGGVSVAYVQISDRQIGAPKFQTGDIVIALSDRAVHRTQKYVGPQTTFVYDSTIQGLEGELPENAGEVLPIPAVEVAKKRVSPAGFQHHYPGCSGGRFRCYYPGAGQGSCREEVGLQIYKTAGTAGFKFPRPGTGRRNGRKARRITALKTRVQLMGKQEERK